MTVVSVETLEELKQTWLRRITCVFYCRFKVKLATYNNSVIYNSVVVFAVSVFDDKYAFRENLVQKIKMVILS